MSRCQHCWGGARPHLGLSPLLTIGLSGAEMSQGWEIANWCAPASFHRGASRAVSR